MSKGKIAKTIAGMAEELMQKSAEKAGMKAPVVANENLTTLQDFHTSLGDRIREEAEATRKMMEGFDYKYDKGQRVFTKDSAAKNRPPYTIINRSRVGNQVIYDTSGGGMKARKDPVTGKTMRTPYEPGYKVRSEIGDEWSEFDIPQSAIIGDVEMKKGGAVKMGKGGIAKSITDMAAELAKKKRAVLPKEEAEANLKKFLDQSKVQQRLYHATPQSFDVFKPGGDNPLVSGPAIWMTPKKESQPAAHNIRKVPGTENRVYGNQSNMFTPGTNVMPLYASLKNPLISTEKTWKKDFEKFGGSPWTLTPEGVEKIKSAGHDGIVYYDAKGNLEEAVAFDPTNVKSAIGNRGTYDIGEEDITKAEGGAVKMQDGGAATANEALLRKSKRLQKVEKPVSISPLQLARGWAAGTAGLPGDIESLGRALIPGVSEENVLPTSEEMLNQIPFGAKDEVGQRAAELGTLFGGLGVGTGAKAVSRGAKAIAPKAGELAEQYAIRTGMVLPMDVWHAGPHKFPPTKKNPLGEFDPTKIGTGEGAQAFGYGHYLAQAPETSKTYWPRSPQFEEKLIKKYNAAQSSKNYEVMEILEDAMLHKLPHEILEKYASGEYTPKHIKAAEEFANWYKKNPPEVGALYKVDLPDEQIAKMLDWDKPLSEQKDVVDLISSHLKTLEKTKTPDRKGVMQNVPVDQMLRDIKEGEISGRNLYDLFVSPDVAGFSPEQTSAIFKEAGIPGIKYLDESSRQAGEGTRNFVVFPGNEDILTIKERMKKGGPVSMDAMRLAVGGMAEGGIKASPSKPGQEFLGKMGKAAEKLGIKLEDAMKIVSQEGNSPIKAALTNFLISDTLKSAGTALQDWTGTPRDATEEFPYRRLMTGKGMTAQFDPRLIDVAPIAGSAAGRVASGIKHLPTDVMKAATAAYSPQATAAHMSPAKKLGMSKFFPGKTYDSLNSAEKSALTRFENEMKNPAVRRREAFSGPTITEATDVVPEPKIVSPEEILKYPLMPLTGDVSGAGYRIKQIAGIPLKDPVDVQGGFKYSLIHELLKDNLGWASMSTAAKKKVLQAYEIAQKTGQSPLAVFTAMTPESINFSTPVVEAMLGQLQAIKPSKEAIKALNKAIKEPFGAYRERPDFVGIESPDVIAQLRGEEDFSKEGAGDLRKKIVELMSKAEYRKMGFPRYDDVADAIIDESLRNAERGLSGSVIFKTDPNAQLVSDPNIVRHLSYDTGIPRDVNSPILQLRDPISAPVIFKDIFRQGMTEGFPLSEADIKKGKVRRALTSDEVLGALMMRNDLVQMPSQQHMDAVMNYMRKNFPKSNYKKGGPVKKAEGGEITADDLIVEERSL
jgi:hypothetical protein